jgi:DHA3 family tetracycline resistance protein-like MFS transporter
MPLPAGRMFLLSRFTWGVLFAMMSTVFMIYQVEVAGLSPLQLVLVGTALELSAFLFEVPTGIVADRYSRKLSVVIGFLITGCAFVLAASFPVFAIIAFGSFIWGIGWTFISGAHEAWLADEVGESEAARLYLRGQKLVGYGGFIGILVAVVIGSIEIHYPYLLSGLLFIGWAAFAWFGMVETRFSPTTESGHLAGMKATFAEGLRTIRGSPTLVLLVIVGVVIGTFSEGYDRLSVAHMLRNFEFPRPLGLEPVVLLGAMAAASNLIAIVAIQVTEKKVDTNRAAQIGTALSLVSFLILSATLWFALTGQILLAIALYVMIMPLRVIAEPLTTAWINQHVGSSSRATVLSMHSQSDALGQMMGGPAVGVVGQMFGIRVAISVTAILLAPAIFLYRRAREIA